MRVKVWNDNIYPHVEMFKDVKIEIPSKGFVEMDYEDAIYFKSQFTVPVTDGERNPIDKHFKMIRLEVPKIAVAPNPLMCHATGKIAANAAELAAMNAANAHLLADPDDASVRLKDRNDALEAEVAELRARLAPEPEKRGPGRPRKEA